MMGLVTEEGRVRFQKFIPPQATPLVGDALTKPFDNGICEIRTHSADATGAVRPYLSAVPLTVEDGEKRAVVLPQLTPADRDRFGSKLEDFGGWVKETAAGLRDYTAPPYDAAKWPTYYKYNVTVGARRTQVVQELTRLATELCTRPGEPGERGAPRVDEAKLDGYLRHVNLQATKLFDGKVVFDDRQMHGYGGWSHDHVFVHPYERRLAQLQNVDSELGSPQEAASRAHEKRQLQAKIDHIFRRNYVVTGRLEELDAERSMGVVAIDAKGRQRVSETQQTCDARALIPRYEVLSVLDGDARKAVYYDAARKQYYHDGTGTVVPEALHAKIERTPVPTTQIVFRRAKETDGEHLREGFRFPWRNNRDVQRTPVTWVSWAGFCNNKGILEAYGLPLPEEHGGVVVWESSARAGEAPGEPVNYDRDLLNEALLSFDALGRDMQDPRTGRRTAIGGETGFAGAREDAEPDRLSFGLGESWATMPYGSQRDALRFTEIKLPKTDPGTGEVMRGADGALVYETHAPQALFAEYTLAADLRSGTKNPCYQTTEEGDMIRVGLKEAVIRGTTNLTDIDADGYPVERASDFTIDWAHPPAEPIVLSTVLQDAAARQVLEFKLDVANKKLGHQRVHYERQDDGKFKRVEDGSVTWARGTIDPDKVVGLRETPLDNPRTWLPFLERARRTGVNCVADTAHGQGYGGRPSPETGAGVWNGALRALDHGSSDVYEVTDAKGATRSWRHTKVGLDARFGSNRGEFLTRLNERGLADFYVPVAAPADFLWSTPIATAPVRDGMLNVTAKAEGLVYYEDRAYHAEALSNLMVLLNAAYQQYPYLIWHQGVPYAFRDEAGFKAAKAELQRLQTEAYAPPAPAPEPVPEPFRVAAHVGKKEEARFCLEALGDGDLCVRLKTTQGDADLFGKKGDQVSRSDYDFDSQAYDLADDSFTVPLKKGDKLSLLVCGWHASDYELSVEGAPVRPV